MVFGRFNKAAKRMVDELFLVEAEADHQDAQQTQISVKVGVSTAAMLTVLSDLFSQSRYAFTGEILEDFTADLFFNLPEVKRAEIAAKADQLTTELLAKQGVTVESNGPAGHIQGDQTWRMWNANSGLLEVYAKEQESA